MKRFIVILFAVMLVSTGWAQQKNEMTVPDAPSMTFVMQLKVKLGEGYGCGQNTKGNRFIIPIIGGTFQGPEIKGEVLPGGADYQLQNLEKGRSDIEAIYSLRTDDGINIHIRNVGIIAKGYFYCQPKFEAPMDSKYGYLNDALYVCRPAGFEEGAIVLNVWKVG